MLKQMCQAVAALAMGAFMFAIPAGAADQPAGSTDSKFIMKAAQGGLMEVKLGRLAQDHASNADVKAFGARMVTDHTKANNELEVMAKGKGIDVSADKLTLPADDQAMMETLEKLNGADFDRMYIKHMVEDHQQDISEFENEAKGGTDKDVKYFASKTLPTLKEHLRLAEAAQAKLGK